MAAVLPLPPPSGYVPNRIQEVPTVPIIIVLILLVLGVELISRIHININIAVPTLPSLIAIEIIRRLIRSALRSKEE